MSAAVLLMAYGGAESVEELPLFLERIMRGPVAKQVLKRTEERYRGIGGRSPLCEVTRGQARALQASLNGSGKGEYRVTAAFRYSKPSIEDAVRELSRQGHSRVIALPMTPFSSLCAASGYEREFCHAVRRNGARLDVEWIRGWHGHPGLADAFSRGVRDAVRNAVDPCARESALVFMSHSLPERLLPHGDPYTKDLGDAACAVAAGAGFDGWCLAFQGRGESGSWLGPEAGDVFAELREMGVERVVLSPIGYLAENVETLYECDILHRREAEKMGLEFLRVPAPGDSPDLVSVLADLVLRSGGS